LCLWGAIGQALFVPFCPPSTKSGQRFDQFEFVAGFVCPEISVHPIVLAGPKRFLAKNHASRMVFIFNAL